MIYSHTQISRYLHCPKSYRYSYLDGWREKETRAAMAFGRPITSLPRLADADVVVSLDADPLGAGPRQIVHARGFAARRQARKGVDGIGRLYAVESAPTQLRAPLIIGSPEFMFR